MPVVSTHTHTHSVVAFTCQLTPRTLCGSMHGCVFVCVCKETFLKAKLCPMGENRLAGAVSCLRCINANTQTCTSNGAFRVLTSPFCLEFFVHFVTSLSPLTPSHLFFRIPFCSHFLLLPLILFLSDPDSLIDRVTGMRMRIKPAGSIQTLARPLTIWHKGAWGMAGTWHAVS